MVAIKTLVFTVFVPGTVAGLLPYLIASGDGTAVGWPGTVRWAGLFVFIPGILLYAKCAWDFTFTGRGTPSPGDPPKELVIRDFYRFCRNPMYVGVVSVVAGEGLLYGSWRVLFYAAFLLMAFHLRVVYYEEPVLKGLFGDAYSAYCAEVPRWLPRRRRG